MFFLKNIKLNIYQSLFFSLFLCWNFFYFKYFFNFFLKFILLISKLTFYFNIYTTFFFFKSVIIYFKNNFFWSKQYNIKKFSFLKAKKFFLIKNKNIKFIKYKIFLKKSFSYIKYHRSFLSFFFLKKVKTSKFFNKQISKYQSRSTFLFFYFFFFKSKLVFTFNDLIFFFLNGYIFLNNKKLNCLNLKINKKFFMFSFLLNKNYYYYYLFFLKKIKKLRLNFYKKFFKLQKLKLNFYKQQMSNYSSKFLNLIFLKKKSNKFFELDFFSINFIVLPSYFYFFNLSFSNFLNCLLFRQYNWKYIV